MKLMRVGEPGSEVPAVVDGEGLVRDLRPVAPEVDAELLGRLDDVRAALAGGTLPLLRTDGLRIGSPIAAKGKVVCVGINYRSHAHESGLEIPAEPVIFLKTAYTVVGPNDTVLIPRRSRKTDYEVELAVVIGRQARYVDSAADGLSCVAGYAISHDVSEREFQLERGGTWDKGKNCETFNPLGPWLVTADEVPDPQALGLRLRVNGESRQQASTAEMVFGVGEIIRYISQFMVLLPGDIINTGTPAGCAIGYPEPKPYLRAGDVVDLEIDGLGQQSQTMGQA